MDSRYFTRLSGLVACDQAVPDKALSQASNMVPRMGKASRGKQEARQERRSRSDLLELLAENQDFLERSAAGFDEGYEAEAKRLAVVLRVLLHDTRTSHSLLQQLGIKERMDFLDTAQPIDPMNLLPTPGLVMMRMTTSEHGNSAEYVAKLGGGATSPRQARFAGWWGNPVMKVDGTWSRKELVLSLANQEGGAHVDPRLNERYEHLAKRNGLGWRAVSGTSVEPFRGSAVAAAVRQIAYEVGESLKQVRALNQLER